MLTLSNKMLASDNRPAGFDYLRVILSVAVVLWHSIGVSYGWNAETPFWHGPVGALVYAIVPAFFALSGFLVAGSLLRNSIRVFLMLRVLRIVPALFVEVIVSALIIGPLVTSYPLYTYAADPLFRNYFLNIVGIIQYQLPGVFTLNPAGGIVNVQLWTIPFELECYIAIVMLGLIRLHRAPHLFSMATFCVCILFTGYLIHAGVTTTVSPRPPGRMVVCCFMAGVSLYLLRQRLPFDGRLFAVSLLVSYILLQNSNLVYLACFPLSYATVYIGVMNPKRDLLGRIADYSYGIYLYGFPIQQLISFIWPDHRSWMLNASLSLIITLGLAAISFHIIEEPALARKGFLIRALERRK